MKRDMDLIRKLMLMIEQSEDCCLESWKIDGVDSDVAGYHFELLEDAGFILWGPRGLDGTREPPVIRHTAGITMMFSGLSWSGCEFIDRVRDESVWKHVKGKAGAFASVSFSILSSLATAYIKKQLGLSD